MPRRLADRLIAFAATLVLLTLVGCQIERGAAGLPDKHHVVREPLNVHSDIRLTKRHRLLDDLIGGREDLSEKLLLPSSDESIDVYVFEEQAAFEKLIRERFPQFPDRRAIFVRTDESLSVYAVWSDRIGEDLRHEITHAYVHSVVPNLPLWIDEGLAEYFEVGRGRDGVHREHIAQLLDLSLKSGWRPDLRRLEQCSLSDEMSELEYCESWLWVHFLLESGPEPRQLLQNQLARLRMSAEAGPMSEQIDKYLPNATNQVMEHLYALAEKVAQPTAEIAGR